MKIERFEEILSWQKSKQLTIVPYHLFKNEKNFVFKNQILRASLSIMNIIAEGFERRTNNEFKHFLFIPKGSCGEVRSMPILLKELNLIEEHDFKLNHDLSTEI